MNKNSLERGMVGRSSPENKNHRKAVWWIKAHRTKTRRKEVWWAEADETKTHWKVVWRIKVIWTKNHLKVGWRLKLLLNFIFTAGKGSPEKWYGGQNSPDTKTYLKRYSRQKTISLTLSTCKLLVNKDAFVSVSVSPIVSFYSSRPEVALTTVESPRTNCL